MNFNEYVKILFTSKWELSLNERLYEIKEHQWERPILRQTNAPNEKTCRSKVVSIIPFQ